MKNRIALVTGASQGIGRACALILAQHGSRVIAAARQQEKLAQLVEEIRATGGEAAAVALDVASAESIAAAFRDRKSTRLNSSHIQKSRMPSSA